MFLEKKGPVGIALVCTARCSEIGSHDQESLDAPEFHTSSDVREPISLHQAVHAIMVYKHIHPTPGAVMGLHV